MGFLDHLRQVQAQRMDERWGQVVQARMQWLGRRVAIYQPGLAGYAKSQGAYVEVDEDQSWVFGEVVEINDYGDVRLAYAVGRRGEVFYKDLRLETLGDTCVLAES